MQNGKAINIENGKGGKMKMETDVVNGVIEVIQSIPVLPRVDVTISFFPTHMITAWINHRHEVEWHAYTGAHTHTHTHHSGSPGLLAATIPQYLAMSGHREQNEYQTLFNNIHRCYVLSLIPLYCQRDSATYYGSSSRSCEYDVVYLVL